MTGNMVFIRQVRSRAIFVLLNVAKYVVGCSCVDSKPLKHIFHNREVYITNIDLVLCHTFQKIKYNYINTNFLN